MKLRKQLTLKSKEKQLERGIRQKFLICFLLLIIVSVYLTSCKTNLGTENNNFLMWQNTKQLTFKDFKGKPSKTKNDLFGHCSTQFRFEHFIDKTSSIPKYSIKCYFNKKLSFISFKNDSVTLRHEQVHFNLTELFCRRTRKSWDSLNKLNEKKLIFYNRVKNKNLVKINSLDRLFDYEEHSVLSHSDSFDPKKNIDSILKKWEFNIERELDSLRDYK